MNVKYLKRTLQIIAMVLLALLFFNSCDVTAHPEAPPPTTIYSDVSATIYLVV